MSVEVNQGNLYTAADTEDAPLRLEGCADCLPYISTGTIQNTAQN